MINSAQTFSVGFTSSGAFLHSSVNFWSLLRMIWAARLLCACIRRTAFASRIGVLEEGGCWLVLVVSALKFKFLFPWLPPHVLVHHLRARVRNARAQLKRSVGSFGVSLLCPAVPLWLLLFRLSFPLHVLCLWSTRSLWPSCRNAFVILQAVGFYDGQELLRKPSA